MAYAMLKGIQSQRDLTASKFYCNDLIQERMLYFADEFIADPVPQIKDLVVNSDVVILAVKPMQIREVLISSQGFFRPSQLVISVAAGIKLNSIETLLPGVPVIRAMPNTPCMVGEGATALSAGTFASTSDMNLACDIFSTMGLAVVLPEKSLDAVTALSGGGPAFIFLITEALINSGVLVGLDADTAKKLVVQTICGSMKMLQETDQHPAILRENVCSPGGTTIEGIKVLEQYGVRAAFLEAIRQACRKSIEIGNELETPLS